MTFKRPCLLTLKAGADLSPGLLVVVKGLHANGGNVNSRADFSLLTRTPGLRRPAKRWAS